MVTKPRGVTLPEVLIVMTLLLGFLGLVSAYFVQGQNYHTDISSFTSVQRNATQTLRRVTETLGHSASLYSQTGPEGALFLSYEPNTQGESDLLLDPISGEITWRKWIALVHQSELRKLTRIDVPLTQNSSELVTVPEPAVLLSDALALPGGSKRTLGEGIDRFAISSFGRGYKIELTTSGNAPISSWDDNKRRIEVTVSSTVAIQN